MPTGLTFATRAMVVTSAFGLTYQGVIRSETDKKDIQAVEQDSSLLSVGVQHRYRIGYGGTMVCQ